MAEDSAPTYEAFVTADQVQTAFTQYTTSKAATQTATTADGIQRATNLRTEIAKLTETIQTYETEFESRMAAGSVAGTGLESRGIATFQDWVLIGFFSSYAFVTIALILYALRYSQTKMFAAGAIFIISLVLAMMLSAVLIQFG